MSAPLLVLAARRGLHIDDLGHALGVDPDTAFRWLSGRQPVPARFVAGLAHVLGVQERELSHHQDPSTPPSGHSPPMPLSGLPRLEGRDALASHLRAQLTRPGRAKVAVSVSEAATVARLLDELAALYASEALGVLAGHLAERLRDRTERPNAV